MKKYLMILGIAFSIIGLETNAQAFTKDNFNVDVGYVFGSRVGGGFLSPGVLVNAEKGIHKWIGVGAYVGAQYNVGFGIGYLNVPFGGTGSFHFYQMISDLVGSEMGSDKLDVSAKLSLGANLLMLNGTGVFFNWGSSLNARYFFTDNFGIYAEVGLPTMGFAVAGAALKF